MGVISKKDFAELAKISQSTVSNRIRRGVLPESGGGIDISDQKVIEYLASRGIRVEPGKEPPLRAPPPVDPEPLETKEALTVKKLAAQIQEIELKNAMKEGRLVAREVMVSGVWNPLETFLVRILSDGAKTMSKTVYPIVKSDGTREEVEVAIRRELTSFIIPLKESIQKALKLEDV